VLFDNLTYCEIYTKIVYNNSFSTFQMRNLKTAWFMLFMKTIAVGRFHSFIGHEGP